MRGICIGLGSIAGGYLGYLVFPGAGMMTQFIVSGIGSMAGVVAGWKLARVIERWMSV